MISLKHLMQESFGITPDVVQYGKPSLLTFEYARDQLIMQAATAGLEISHFYMIGDNPSGDIYGANSMHLGRGQGAAWSSILVQTGVHHADSHHKLEGLFKPTHEVKDMHDAI